MKSFKPPRGNDLKRLAKVIAERASKANAHLFAPHSASWLAVWKEYLKKKANVTEIPANRNPWATINDPLKKLYPGNKGQVQEKYIKSLRNRFRKDTYLLCPYCGRAFFEELDHYLPKTSYPEFSVLSKNLVPSCGDCNGLKGSKAPNGKDEFFLHPYYDVGLSDQLLYFEVLPPYDTPKIRLKISSGLPTKLKSRLEFQVRELNLKARLKHEAIRELRSVTEFLGNGKFRTFNELIEYLDRCCESEFSKYQSKNSTPYLLYKSIRNDNNYLNFIKTCYNLP